MATKSNHSAFMQALSDMEAQGSRSFSGGTRKKKKEPQRVTPAQNLKPLDSHKPMTSTPTSKVVPKKNPGAIDAMKAGFFDVHSTIGSAMQWLGAEEAGAKYKAPADRAREYYGGNIEHKDFSVKSLVDPDFYKHNVARAVPFTVALLPAAIAGAGAGTGAAAAVGLGTFGRLVLGSIGASMASRPLEGALEAGGTFEEARSRGMSLGESRKAGTDVFKKNLALTGMDAAEFALAFAPKQLGPLAKLAKAGKMGKVAAGAAKLGGVAAMEAGEEGIQEVFNRQALGDEIALDPQMKEAMAIGGIFGAGLGGAGEVYQGARRMVEPQSTSSPQKCSGSRRSLMRQTCSTTSWGACL